MNLQLDAGAVVVLGTAIALFFWLMRAVGAWLISIGAEPVGNAINSVYA